ncbi:WD40 repeat domain-containing protein [Frigoriglobus tundricola]|uniref:WD40 repeat domain-containing protein n=1 Tax=Frigoriglobus tundricola TaxID=2774151 RepID=UPI0036F2341B
MWRAPTVQRWDVASGKATWPVTWDQGHTEAVTRLSFVPHGTLISSANDSTNYVWDLASGRPKYRLPKGYGDLTTLTPDGRTLFTGATSSSREPLKGWDLATGKETRTLKGDVSFPQYGSSGDQEAAVTADGKRLVTLTDNHIGNERIPPGRYLTVWDLATGKLDREEKVDTRENETVLAPGGDVYLAFSRNDPNPSARLISTATGKELRRLAEDALTGNGARRVTMKSVFSPDGRLVATRVINETATGLSVGDRPVRVWAVATARALADFPTTGPAHFAFAPDGRTLVVTGADGFRVYELATRKEARTVAATGVPRGRKPGPFATALAVGPVGRTVATGHADGTVLIWDAAPPLAALGPADMGSAWKALADPDPKVGRAAVFRLADAPDLALRLFEERLKPAAPDPRAAALVQRLGADEFQEREAAEKELRALGTRAGPALAAALAGAPSAELRTRAERLMSAVSPSAPLFGEDLRDVRAVAVLEAIDSTASRQLLKRLATGAPEVHLTREAKSALGASQR